jgi:hypothetical protein
MQNFVCVSYTMNRTEPQIGKTHKPQPAAGASQAVGCLAFMAFSGIYGIEHLAFAVFQAARC